MQTRLLLLCLLLVCLVGCGYGEVSPASYEYAKALYSACNRKSTESLGKIQEDLRRAEEAGDISSQEANWLEDIIRAAENEKWEAAMNSARRMMDDQVQQD